MSPFKFTLASETPMPKLLLRQSLLLTAILATAVTGSSSAKEIALPPETILLKQSDLPGYALASGYCVLCHSADYVHYQPPAKPRSFWLAEVTKMQKKYGAPVPDAQVDLIVDYLTSIYGSSPPTAASAAAQGAHN